jgi:uncharacterized membrane protein YphA (DoxX/SURF4 family)
MRPILDKHTFGPWAVITGSASGIGKAIATPTIAFWAVTVGVCVAFVGSGFANLVHSPRIAADMARLGYPAYFSTILGAWKVLGAAAIVAPRLPRLKEWAYAGMIFDLSGAAISRGMSGDGAAGVVPPMIVAALVVASWALRPADRVLLSTGSPGVSP